MSQPKTYTLQEIFNSARIGFVLEFYSSKDVNFVVKQLSEITRKGITLTNEVFHTPTYSTSVLVKEYDGDKPRYSLYIAPQEFNSAVPMVKDTLKWISETAECTKDTLMRVTLSFDHRQLQTLNSISQMSAHKLIMKFNESYVYERFPKQKDSPYAMSIKQLSPMNENVYVNDLVKNVNYIIGIPSGNHFGINFEDQTKGILEFNYIGGQNYAYKEKEITEMLEYYVIKTYQSLNESDYTRDETNELRNMTDQFYKIQEAYYDPQAFSKMFPDITVAVDLRRDTQMLKTFWPKIRVALFEAVINNKFTKGQFNYDTDRSIFQIRGAELKCTKITNFDLVKCKVSGVLEGCYLWSCEVKNARMVNCRIVKSTDVYESYLKSTTVDKSNTINQCFIENTNEMIDCTIKESVIKFAGIGSFAKLDESSVIIERKDTTQVAAKGVEVEEIRDYKWIKKLSGKEETGHIFGNQYTKKKFL